MAKKKTKKKSRKKKKKQNKFFRNKKGNISFSKILSVSVSLVLLLTILSACSCYYFSPDVGWLADKNPNTTSFIKDRNQIYKKQGKQPIKLEYWLSYNQLPKHLIQAIRIAEDDAFFQHNGFDFNQLKESLKSYFHRKKTLRGASTITQQLGKNLFLSEGRSLIRKLQEIPITIKLEKQLSKKRIFEIYVNVIEFGDGIYGVEAASRHYFGKHTIDLNYDEAIFLAAIIKRPRYYQTHRDAGAFVQRQDTILYRMAVYGYIK